MSAQDRRDVWQHKSVRDGNPVTPAIEIGAAMNLPKIYEQAACAYHVRYAIANILRDHTVNEGAFKGCFEMEDGDEVVLAILRRGLKNPRLRRALETSHLVNLTGQLFLHPEFFEPYYANETRTSDKRSRQTEKHNSARLRSMD